MDGSDSTRSQATAGVVYNEQRVYRRSYLRPACCEYLWGDTVNVASRIQRAAKPDEIQLSDATREFLDAKFFCTAAGEIETRGAGRVGVWRLDRESKNAPCGVAPSVRNFSAMPTLFKDVRSTIWAIGPCEGFGWPQRRSADRRD
jgi:Adenylate and Guanylate cyclase catalytic domain